MDVRAVEGDGVRRSRGQQCGPAAANCFHGEVGIGQPTGAAFVDVATEFAERDLGRRRLASASDIVHRCRRGIWAAPERRARSSAGTAEPERMSRNRTIPDSATVLIRKLQ